MNNTYFKITGEILPPEFNANKLCDDTKKDTKSDTTNVNLSYNDLIDKFSKNSAEGVKVRKNLKRSMIRYKKKFQLDNVSDEYLIENYHYFTCPITGEMISCFENAHFSRFGINKERFLELFPEYNDCYIHPPYSTIKKRKLRNEKAVMEEANRKKVYADVDGKKVDVYKLSKDISERYIKDYLKRHHVNDPIENYHYFTCPITGIMISVFNDIYFKKLSEHGVTKSDFQVQFPYVKLDISTPFSRNYTFEEYQNGLHEFNAGVGKWTRVKQKSEAFKTSYVGDIEIRNEHLSKSEILKLVEDKDDPVIEEYMEHISRYDSDETLEKISNDRNVKVEDLVEFHDYFIHPLTNHVCQRITDKMIKPFGITKERFDTLFQGYSGATNNLMEKIDNVKLTSIDPNGFNVYQLTSLKRSNTMLNVMSNGKTIQENSTEKMLNTKKNTIDRYGRNIYQREADKNILSSHKTNSKEVGDDPYLRYEAIINSVTNKIREFYKMQGYTLARIGKNHANSHNNYQLDHKFSITEGYENDISPMCIANILNVEIMTVYDNSKKGNKSSITINDLCNLNNMSLSEMKDEYQQIMSVIQSDIADEKYHNTMSVLIRAGDDIALKMEPYYKFQRFVDEKSNEIINEDLFDVTFNYFFQ